MGNRYYSGEKSDHFDGSRFFLPGLPPSDKSLFDVLRWQMTSQRAPWPEVVPAGSGVRPAARVESLQITCIGHSSLLVQVANLNLLVDPVWAERASPLRWAGPRRHNPPGVALSDLPPIDAVLITHNHYDHLDLATLGRLVEAHAPRMVTPLGNDTIIRAAVPRARVESGDWWDSFELARDLRVTITPSYHWSSRTLRDRRMALWGGFLLESPAGAVFLAGDTAYREGVIFPEIRRRFGVPLVAVLPIGAYEPRWFMETQHVMPEEALQIANALGARTLLGVHWGTFQLTDEPYDQPAQRLAQAFAAQRDAALEVAMPMRPGDSWTPAV